MAKQTRRILVPHGCIAKLCADCNAAPTTVRYALYGYSGTDKAETIRATAIKKYNGKYA